MVEGKDGFEASLSNAQHNEEETRLHLCNGAALGPQETLFFCFLFVFVLINTVEVT